MVDKMMDGVTPSEWKRERQEQVEKTYKAREEEDLLIAYWYNKFNSRCFVCARLMRPSDFNHQSHCLVKWAMEQERLPGDQRQPKPVRPKLLTHNDIFLFW